MKVIAVTQARIGSTRLPKKILKKINGKSLLEIHLLRILNSKRIDKVKVATTKEPEVEKIIEVANKVGVAYYQGDIQDVLDRFYQTLKNEKADYVVRLTSDCPLIDPVLIDKIIEFTLDNDLEYCSNTLEETYPDGQDVEVFKFSAIEKTWHNAKLTSEREHVTPFIYNNSDVKGKDLFRAMAFPSDNNYNHVRLTVDEPIDFEVIKQLIDEIGINASWQEYTDLYLKTDIGQLNKNIIRNEGYQNSLKKD